MTEQRNGEINRNSTTSMYIKTSKQKEVLLRFLKIKVIHVMSQIINFMFFDTTDNKNIRYKNNAATNFVSTIRP